VPAPRTVAHVPLQFYGGNGINDGGRPLLGLCGLLASLDTVRHTVRNVYAQPEEQPNAETDPRVYVQLHHQVNVQRDAHARDERHERDLHNKKVECSYRRALQNVTVSYFFGLSTRTNDY
jgi:hypothetical protein